LNIKGGRKRRPRAGAGGGGGGFYRLKLWENFLEKMGLFCRNGRDYKRKTNCLIRNMLHSVYKQ